MYNAISYNPSVYSEGFCKSLIFAGIYPVTLVNETPISICNLLFVFTSPEIEDFSLNMSG